MARLSHGSKRNKTLVLTNHFKVNDGRLFLHCCVSFKDGLPVGGECIGRKIIDKVYKTHDNELTEKDFTYGREKSLFTVDAFPSNKLEFTIVLENVTSNRNKGNTIPDGHDSPNEHDKKRLR
ncbi:hypothetical protein REPUB_Repub19eG0108000 [Reevesia pubescens]